MAARCASVGACENAGDAIKNDALANDAKSIAGRLDELSIWINPVGVAGSSRFKMKFEKRRSSESRTTPLLFCLTCKPKVHPRMRTAVTP
jgi:hypothetical protein